MDYDGGDDSVFDKPLTAIEKVSLFSKRRKKIKFWKKDKVNPHCYQQEQKPE